MWIVGLTGGLSSGKSTVANLFSEFGIPVIDTDHLSQEVVTPPSSSLDLIVAHFGKTILHPDGTLNRKKLRLIIFNDLTEKKWLEDLLHPLIYQQVSAKLIEENEKNTLWSVVAIPLLVESGPLFRSLLHRILVIDCPETLQLIRTCQRDNLSLETAQKMLSQQASREDRLAIADDVICNDGTLEQLETQITDLYNQYQKLAQAFHSSP